MNNKKIKIAVLSPIPFYYHIPIYKRIFENENIDFNVIYCADWKSINQNYFNRSNLLSGYKYKFLKNYSFFPSLTKFLGLVNLGIINEVRRNNYNAFILQSWGTLTFWLAFFACLIYKKPIIFMTDCNILSVPKKQSIKKHFKDKLLRYFFKNTSWFLSQGTVNKNFYKYYGVSDKKILNFPYTWGYEWFLEKSDKLKPQREAMRQKLGIKEEDFVFLIVCRLEPEKNIFLLLDAFRDLNIKNKKLFIVGQGVLLQKIKEYINNFNIKNVFLTGFKNCNELIEYYNIADAFVLSSSYEPWGMVINEAMCFGLPVIASDRVGAAVDLVIENYNGFIFSYNKPDDLAKKLFKISSLSIDEKRAFSEKSKLAIIKWLERMNPSKKINKIVELLK